MIEREVLAGALLSFDIGKRHRFETPGGYWNTGPVEQVDGTIVNIQHKKNGQVRVQITPEEKDGLRFGHNLVYDRYDKVIILEIGEN